MNLTDSLKKMPVVAIVATLVACGGNSEPAASGDTASEAGQAGISRPVADAGVPPDTTKLTYDCPTDELTVIDICLGMPVDQVKAVLLKRYPDTPINERLATVDYSDGAQTLRTDPFISEIRLETENDEYLEFSFSAPPGEALLTHMTRRMGGSEANLPAIEPFVAALLERYGEPTFRQNGSAGTVLTRVLRWDFPAGRMQCSGPPQDNSGLVMGAVGRLHVGFDLDSKQRQLADQGVDDIAKCAKWLQVYLQTFAEDEPVRSVQTELTDFATAVAELRETYAWLEAKEAQARAERLESAEVPDL